MKIKNPKTEEEIYIYSAILKFTKKTDMFLKMFVLLFIIKKDLKEEKKISRFQKR